MKILPICLLSPVLAIIVNAAEFHISPSGNDENPGTQEKPVASLERARDLARGIAGREDIKVWLHDGTWRLKQTFELDSRDSGRDGHKMIYAAAPGEHPVISGSRRITGWSPAPSMPGVYRAPAGKEVIRQCYVDGKWAQRARGSYFKLAESNPAEGTLTLPLAGLPKPLTDHPPEDLELFACVHWRCLIVHPRNPRPGKNNHLIFSLSPEARQFYSKPAPPVAGDTCHLENALVLLDEPGEWYHSPADGFLYYMPQTGQSMPQTDVEVPSLETLVRITGSKEKPVSYLEFRGITLEGTAWTRPSAHGIYATQFAQPYTQGSTYDAAGKLISSGQPLLVPGALMADQTQHFAFRQAIIRLTGGHALHLRNAQASDIEHNVIQDIGCNAIDGGGSMLNTAIWNNAITRCGRHLTNGGAILLSNPTSGTLIEHNHIYDLPYSGIQVGNQPGGYNDTGTRDNKIRYNHIHHCMQLHDDGGGIYTLGGQQRGTEISYNFIHHILRSPLAGDWPVDGVYLDNYTQFVHVHDNVIRHCTVAAKEQNHSKDNIIERNPEQSPDIEKRAGILPGYNPRNP